MALLEVEWLAAPGGFIGGPEEPWILMLDPGTESAAMTELLQAHLGKHMLVKLEVYDATAVTAVLGIDGALDAYPDYPDSADGTWGWSGGTTVHYPVATLERSSSNDDTPAKTFVPGRLMPFDYSTKLFDSVDPFSRSRPAAGSLNLMDPDHQLDGLIDYVWDSAKVTLLRGKASQKFNEWEEVAKYRTSALVYDSDEKLIRLRDLGWQLSGPLHDDRYDGTGGINGDSTLTGRLRPWCLGYCFNVSPVLVNASAQIFQFNLTSSQAVLEFRHGGVPLTFYADYPDYAALAAATIPSSQYGTCLAQSLVRPNVTLQYGVTLDVAGDADTAFGHGPPNTRVPIVRRIATTRGAAVLDDALEIDSATFNDVGAYHSATVGFYFNEEISKAEAIDRVMAGVMGWWYMKPIGTLAVAFLQDPEYTVSVLNLQHQSFGMGKLHMTDTAPPRSGTVLSWRDNYTIQDRSSLAGSVTAANAAIYGQNARYAVSLNPLTTSIYPTAKKTVVDNTGFWYEVDAVSEVNRQQTIMGVQRYRWEVELDIDPFSDILGKSIRLQNANILGLGTTKPLVCVEKRTPGLGITTFGFFA